MAPRFPRWSAIRPPSRPRPLSAIEIREHHAIRMALFLTAGVMQSATFVDGPHPIAPASIERCAWLRQALRPLVRRCPTIAILVRLVDLEGPEIVWDNPLTLRRHLRRLAMEAQRLGSTRVGRRQAPGRLA